MFQRVDSWLNGHSELFGIQIEHWMAVLAAIALITALVAWLERRTVTNGTARDLKRDGYSSNRRAA